MDSILTAPQVEDALLPALGANTARLLPLRGEGGAGQSLRVLRRSGEELRRCCALLRRRAASAERIPAAWEWLLDNAYLARREQLSAAGDLSRARHLRRSGGEPAICGLARALVLSGRGRVTAERLALFLDGAQRLTPLRREELLLFPAALRWALLEQLAQVCRFLRRSASQEDLAAPLEAVFTSLRLFATLDLRQTLQRADPIDAILQGDPSGDYPRMDEESRQCYLDRLARLARREGREEPDFARDLIDRARDQGVHVGSLLFPEPGKGRERAYIAANVLLSLMLTLAIALSRGGPGAALLLLLPLSQLVKGAIDLLLSHLVPPRSVPRLDLSAGVPAEGRTICAVSCLLTDPEGARAMVRHLEELRAACLREGEELRFGLLADLPEAEAAEVPGDAAIIAAAQEGVRALNARYGGGFYLFTRPRRFDGERWTGYERKRGALLALARLCCGEESELQVLGDRSALAGTRFLLALDSDTRLFPGTAGLLIAAMLHPLNAPHIDETAGVVDRGHGVLQPRLGCTLQSATATDFALLFAPDGGSDIYCGPGGELYMDAFAAGGFAGKGLLDARALLRCTARRIPEGRVLSHDVVEGAFLRGGTVGDGQCFDAFPARPLSYYKRLHRWIRGDWQDLPFLFCRDLAEIERWRLFDALRRSLLPPAELLAILAGFFLPGSPLAISAWAALLAVLDGLLLELLHESLQRREGPRLRRFSRVLRGVGGAIVRSFLQLWLLPFDAWVCLSAALTALWRMGVSHRRLLQWQTAAQAERGGRGLGAHLAALWPAELLGLGCLLFASPIIARSAGLLWLLSGLAAFALSLPARREELLSLRDRDYLRDAVSQALDYYRSFCRAEDHFLPPDNYQEQPALGLAHRSSPTNIGLALLSLAAGAELELTDREEATERIAHMIDTLERMPRHRGHLFNWYDTRSLAPLLPAHISTVDSGNLCLCLIAARAALTSWGRADLAGRLDALIREMDFSLLFDRSRGLFYISYDTEREQGVGGWYDLLASEAMLTSYLAVARGQVPLRHWRRLSRALLQKDGYRGLASWTGTMFEYLMPALFLPYCPGSLLHESARFCLYVQRRRRFAGKPWGISESAYYALGADLSYRYKASGCGELALKRGQDEDLVTAPYAAFLALSLAPAAAVEDLRLFERCGARGRRGFFEALDFSPGRCREEDGEKVRCYMAHHVGMSILAGANALGEGLIRRWVLADPALAAHLPLLEERLQDTAPVLRRELERPPERPPRVAESRWSVRGGAEDPDERQCLLTGGSYELQLSRDGRSRAAFRGRTLYGTPALDGPGAALSLTWRGESVDPLAGAGRWELSESRGLWSMETASLLCRCEIFAAAQAPGEGRRISLYALEGGAGALRLALQPRLARDRDWQSHPAYWRLGVEREALDGGLLLHRLPRGEQGGLYLALLASHDAAAVLDDPVSLTLSFTLRAGETAALSFALCAGEDREEAIRGAREILTLPDRSVLVGAFAGRLGMAGEEIGAAMGLLPLLQRPLDGAAPQAALWPYGISGDDPLLVCDGRSPEALPLLRRFLLLKSCGQAAELVYLTDEAGEYRQPLRAQILQLLEGWGLEALLGARGGIHLAPRAAEELLRSRAAVSAGQPRWRFPPVNAPRLSAPREKGAAPNCAWETGSFAFSAPPLPARAWQLILSNGRLGAIACDYGPAALWLGNARELRLIPPVEDLSATQGEELLWVEVGGRPVSLFAANDALPCRVQFSPGLARWEKEIGARQVSTELFLLPWQELRVLILRGAAGLRVNWLLRPCLSPGDASSLRCGVAEGLFWAENAESGREGLRFLAGCSTASELRTDFSPPALLLQTEAEELTVFVCGSAPETELRQLLRPGAALSALAETRGQWQRLLGDLEICTGDEALDRYLTPWAAYQVLACRLLGRGSLYQSGGAYGFRDQLQDAIALLPLDAAYARERIVDACRHQYSEGDVQHWWHPRPDGDRGVRTRCGDDLLWLPWALCAYVEATGDTGLCAREEPGCSSPPLEPREHDRYECPGPGPRLSVLEHARAALDLCLRRGVGEHGLPFFGSGDWNDALDAVDGESVWLGWALSLCCDSFATLLDRLGRPGAEDYRAAARRLGRAADHAWNGHWYRRGYWADGTPLGGDGRIDALPQAFAALSPYASPDRVDAALDAAIRRLVDEEHGLIRLFDPPFDDSERSPGSIVGYGKGVRENGGQYTHGALWLIRALFRRGRRAEGERLLRMLLPTGRDPGRYEAEPFVLAADVSAAPGREGEAGWTWYTGSAGWMLRIVFEDLLGLRLRDGELLLPAAPPRDFTLRWKGREICARGGSIRVDGEHWSGPVPPV